MIGSLNSQVQLLDRFISNRSFQVSCCVDVSCTAIFPLNVRLYEIFMRFHEILRSFMRSHGIVLACCPYFTNNWMLSVISRDFERFHEVYELNMHMSSFQHTLKMPRKNCCSWLFLLFNEVYHSINCIISWMWGSFVPMQIMNI